MQRIKATPGVDQVSAWTWFGGVYKEPKNFFARFAVDADVIFDIRQDLVIPPEQLAGVQTRANGVQRSGEKIAKQYKIKLNDRVVIVGDITIT